MIPGCNSRLGRSDDTMDLIFLFSCLVSLLLFAARDNRQPCTVHELCYDSGALDEIAEQTESFLIGKAS